MSNWIESAKLTRVWDLLVVRGDLRSHYGYGKALRAHVDALMPFFKETVGVDLHYHPNRANEVFPGKILVDAEVDRLIDAASGRVLLLNYATPTQFRRHPSAHNVGLFYWETDRFAASTGWSSLIQLMDEMWVPTEYMRPILVREGFRGPIECFPWPHPELDFLPTEIQRDKSVDLKEVPLFRMPPSGSRFRLFLRGLILFQQVAVRVPGVCRLFNRLSLHRLIGVRLAQKFRLSLEGVKSNHNYVHLAVAQNTPRKGLPLLLAGWMDFLEQNPETGSALVLKVGTLNVNHDAYDQYFELVEMISGMAESRGIEETRIYLALDYFSETQMDALYRSCSGALLSATLGEGFGGPIAEAAVRGVPVICPRHTSLGDLLPLDYPLVAAHDLRHLSMKHLLGVYPLSAVWGLVRPGEFATLIKKVESLELESRSKIVERLRRHLISLCGGEAISMLLDGLMKRVSRRAEGSQMGKLKKKEFTQEQNEVRKIFDHAYLPLSVRSNGGAGEARS